MAKDIHNQPTRFEGGDEDPDQTRLPNGDESDVTIPPDQAKTIKDYEGNKTVPPAGGQTVSPTKHGISNSQMPTQIEPAGDATVPPTQHGLSNSQMPTQIDQDGATIAPTNQPQGTGVNIDLHAQTQQKTLDTINEKKPSSSQTKVNPNIQKVEHLVGKTYQGYRLGKVLGAGGMGAVFLARQISLDRNVAFKVLPPDFAKNAEALARFTREALSAAQMNHHNVIQVIDVGSQENLHFISMEFVKGESLGDMIRRDGRLNVDDAAGYVLQAARGLAYAHDHGIIHRDIKPDNLMINEHGIVKIADMGLVKMQGVNEQIDSKMGENMTMNPQQALIREGSRADLTQTSIGFGTPAYMSPEQAKDAANVDSRADQYSLGCTMYYLCAGKTPYSGTTAFELISKHINEKYTPLDLHIHNVPDAFKVILNKMLEKDPENRYSSMHEVVTDIESYLGVESEDGAYKPREQHLAILDKAVKDFYAAPSLKLRKMVSGGFFAAITALFFISIMFQAFWFAGGFFGLGVLAPLSHFIMNGVKNKGYFFRRTRSVFFGMSAKSWLFFGFGTIIGLATLFIINWLLAWIVFLIIAVGLALGYEFGILKKLEKEQQPALAETQEMLRELRIRGVGEDAIQEFVCRFAGNNWEEFFESLFGYEDMILARSNIAKQEKVKSRKRVAVWRDPIARWLDQIEEYRKVAREKKQLAKVEKARLKAEGKSEKEAEKEAEKQAEQLHKEVQETKTKAKAKKLEKKIKDDNYKSIHKSRESSIGLGMVITVPFSIARIALGAFLLILFANSPAFQLINISENLPALVNKLIEIYYGWGSGGQLLGGLTGAALILTGFSRQVFFPLIIMAGAFLMVTYKPVLGLIGIETNYSEWLAFALVFFGLIGTFGAMKR